MTAVSDPAEHAASDEPTWWTIRSDYLLEMMYRCAGGESVDLVYMEMYANSDYENYEEDNSQ